MDYNACGTSGTELKIYNSDFEGMLCPSRHIVQILSYSEEQFVEHPRGCHEFLEKIQVRSL